MVGVDGLGRLAFCGAPGGPVLPIENRPGLIFWGLPCDEHQDMNLKK